MPSKLVYGAAAAAVGAVLLFSCTTVSPASMDITAPVVVQASLSPVVSPELGTKIGELIAERIKDREDERNAWIAEAKTQIERERADLDAKKAEEDKARLKRMVASSVLVYDKDGHGSGVAITKNTILTAAHVVAEGEDFKIKTNFGETYAAKVLWTSPDRDVALMSVDTTDKPDLIPSEIACRTVELTEPVTLVGNALQSRWRVVQGTVSSLHSMEIPKSDDEPEDAEAARNRGIAETNILVNATINSGDSGGPIYDAEGMIIGLADAVMVQKVEINNPALAGRTAANIGLMVPSSRICPLLGRAS